MTNAGDENRAIRKDKYNTWRDTYLAVGVIASVVLSVAWSIWGFLGGFESLSRVIDNSIGTGALLPSLLALVALKLERIRNPRSEWVVLLRVFLAIMVLVTIFLGYYYYGLGAAVS